MANRVEVSTPSDLEIVVTRMLDAPRNMVWDAHTKPDLIRRWLLGPPGWEMTECVFEAFDGGKYRYAWKHEDGPTMGMGGTNTKVKKPERIDATQLFDGGIMGPEARTVLKLEDVGGKTRCSVTIIHASKEIRDASLATPMAEGMEAGYQRLEKLIAEIS